ncbi:30S ribosomal protein S8 [archaeon BMS3Abin16]|nr:30S ribosomal protein S8 [archaeon BMS3Abin16]GBE56736.1 30S ribosomal protein S8 [archaeon BMS3Bbin16]
MLTDPIADTLSNMKNQERAGNLSCVVRPASKVIGNILKIFKDYGYLETFEFIQDGKGGNFNIRLSGKLNDCGVIRPRYPTSKLSFEKFEKRFLPASGFGVLVVSTSQGIMSHDDAKSRGIGGRLLCYAY